MAGGGVDRLQDAHEAPLSALGVPGSRRAPCPRDPAQRPGEGGQSTHGSDVLTEGGWASGNVALDGFPEEDI